MPVFVALQQSPLELEIFLDQLVSNPKMGKKGMKSVPDCEADCRPAFLKTITSSFTAYFRIEFALCEYFIVEGT